MADSRVVVTPRENLAGAAETEEGVAAPETPTGGEVSVRDTWRNFWQLLKLRSAGRPTRTRCLLTNNKHQLGSQPGPVVMWKGHVKNTE